MTEKPKIIIYKKYPKINTFQGRLLHSNHSLYTLPIVPSELNGRNTACVK